MSSKQVKNGFTLIELLVVVLIIGILAAVALPQYNKAVEKSRQAEAWSMMKSIQSAAKVYEMEQGSTGGTINWEDLSLQFVQSANASGTATGDVGASSLRIGKWLYLYDSSDGWTEAVSTEGPWYVLKLSPNGEKFCGTTADCCEKTGAKTSSPNATCGGMEGGSCYPM